MSDLMAMRRAQLQDIVRRYNNRIEVRVAERAGGRFDIALEVDGLEVGYVNLLGAQPFGVYTGAAGEVLAADAEGELVQPPLADDLLDRWLAEECVRGDALALNTATESLHNAFSAWMRSQPVAEFERAKWNRVRFSRELSRRGIECFKGPSGTRLRAGIRLRTREAEALS